MVNGDDRNLGRMESDIEHLEEQAKIAAGVCDRCLVRKIVYAMISLMALAVMGGLLALVIVKPH